MYILLNEYQIEEEIKKSKFIVYAKYINDENEAFDFLQSIKDDKANHNCWAFKIGDIVRFSDDGEPSGTAGKPILNSIIYNNFDNIIIVVTRYFGGIKLGAGGLIRAYSGVTAKCLMNAPKQERINYTKFKINFPYDISKKIYTFIKKNNIIKIDENYAEDSICLNLKIEENNYEKIKKDLLNYTNGIVKSQIE